MKIFKTFVLISTVALTVFLTSCSTLTELLDEMGASGLGDTLETAWSEVGAETLKDIADEAWREYGFGSSLNWPKEGIGQNVPKLRAGSNEYTYIADDKKSGCIKLSGISDDDYSEYITLLESYGFDVTLAFSSMDEIYTFDGLYIGLLRDGENIYICYGESVSSLNATYADSLEKTVS